MTKPLLERLTQKDVAEKIIPSIEAILTGEPPPMNIEGLFFCYFALNGNAHPLLISPLLL